MIELSKIILLFNLRDETGFPRPRSKLMSRRACERQLVQCKVDVRADGASPRFMIYDAVLLLASLLLILLFFLRVVLNIFTLQWKSKNL